MLDKVVVQRLETLAQEIKEIAPQLTGQIVFNCAEKMPKVKVTVVIADATEVRK